MRIELSPGDWAGVYDAVRARVNDYRRMADRDERDGFENLPRSMRSAADDLDRVAKSLREQIAEAGRELPELTMPPDVEDPDDDVEVTCPHVWTQAEVDRMRQSDDEYNALGREMHGDAWHELRREYPEVGSVCGDSVLFWELEPMMRYGYWRGGVIHLGDSKFGDGGEYDDVNCGAGHYFAWPEEVEYL